MHRIINSANRINYLIKKAKPLNNHLSNVQWLNDCTGPWDGRRCWRGVLSFLLYHSALGIKVFGCSSNSGGRSCPRADCLDLKHSAPDRWLAVPHYSSLCLCVTFYLRWTASLHHSFIKLQSSHTYPGIPYSSFCCNVFLCTTYPDILFN